MPESSQAQTAPHRERTSPQRSESLWGNPTYRQWFTADTASTIGAAMKGFAISLIAFSLTQSVVLAGWLATFSQIATHVSDVFGGTVVDRHNRKGLIHRQRRVRHAAVGNGVRADRPACDRIPDIRHRDGRGVSGQRTTRQRDQRDAAHDHSRPRISEGAKPQSGRDSVVSIAGSPLGGVLYAVAPWLPFAVALADVRDQRCQCRPAARRRTCPRHGDDRSQEQAVPTPRRKRTARPMPPSRPTPMRQQSRRTPRSSRISSKDGAGRCAGTRCWRSA